MQQINMFIHFLFLFVFQSINPTSHTSKLYLLMFTYYTVLTPADPEFHIDKSRFTVPFVCGARDLGEALRRIAEGATMIRTKGEAGTGMSAATSHSQVCR